MYFALKTKKSLKICNNQRKEAIEGKALSFSIRAVEEEEQISVTKVSTTRLNHIVRRRLLPPNTTITEKQSKQWKQNKKTKKKHNINRGE
jgi:predicted thioesterase